MVGVYYRLLRSTASDIRDESSILLVSSEFTRIVSLLLTNADFRYAYSLCVDFRYC